MRICSFLIAWNVIALFGNDASALESVTLKKIKETGVISIGFRVGSMPLSYVDNKQRPIGYSIDLCNVVIDAVKSKLKLASLEIKYIPVTSANRIPLIKNGIIDLECGSTTNSVERQRSVSFTITTFVASAHLLSKKDLNIQSIDDLKEQSVVSTAGTTSAALLAELNQSRGLGINILLTNDHVEAFKMVETNRAATFIMDDVILYSLVANARNPYDYVISNEALSNEPYGMIVRKDDPEFKNIADKALINLFKTGEINHIYRKWFQSPIAPKQVNLQMPMSDALKDVISHYADSAN
ncbi:MAG TPA: amino acid ABC transporter substrate-binding protein [Burkholderiaceae bacterium]|jgi:glutamate/aspartate transport system substrate-binding protein